MLRRGRYACMRFRGIAATRRGGRNSGKKRRRMMVVDVVESRGAGN